MRTLKSLYLFVNPRCFIEKLNDEESQSLAPLGDFIGKPISLQMETLYMQEQYGIADAGYDASRGSTAAIP